MSAVRGVPLRAHTEPAIRARRALRVELRAPSLHRARHDPDDHRGLSLRLDAYNYYIDGHGAGGAFSYVDQHASVQADLVLPRDSSARRSPCSSPAGRGHVRMALVTVARRVARAVPPACAKVAPALAWRLARSRARSRRVTSSCCRRSDYSRRAYKSATASRPTMRRRDSPRLERAAHGVSALGSGDPRPRGSAAAARRVVPWVGWTGHARRPDGVAPRTAGAERRRRARRGRSHAFLRRPSTDEASPCTRSCRGLLPPRMRSSRR